MDQRCLVNINTFAACLAVFFGVVACSAATVWAEVESRLELGASLRGVADGGVEQGEPLRVDIRLWMDANAEPGSVLLAPVSGTWIDAIEVQLIDAQGRPSGVRAQAVGRPESAATTLSPGRIAGGLWRVAPGATQALKPGDYALRARLAVGVAAPGSGGWTGEVLSQDIPVKIVAPSDLPRRRAQRALALAQDLLLDDRMEEAATVLDALLAEQPDNVRVWTVRAVVSERAGNILGALRSVYEAHRLYNALGRDEPYVELHTIQGRLMAALAEPDAADKAAAPLPSWTWPPRGLLSQPPVAPAPEADAGKTAASPPKPPSEPKPDAAPVVAAEPSATIVPFTEFDEADILADPRGQWATTASASSEYGKDRYSAAQATGAPNVATYSDNPNAWCHSGASRPEEWIDVGFAQSVRATELRVRQSYTPGTLVKVEAFAADGHADVLWESLDPNTYPKGQISWFVLRFPATPFPVQRVKLTMKVSLTPGWKQIDAVQLVGDAP